MIRKIGTMLVGNLILILGVTLSVTFSLKPLLAQTISNAEKCRFELAHRAEVEAMIMAFQKDCAKLPLRLVDLVEDKGSCAKRHASTALTADELNAKRKFFQGFFYRREMKNFTLMPMDCPS